MLVVGFWFLGRSAVSPIVVQAFGSVATCVVVSLLRLLRLFRVLRLPRLLRLQRLQLHRGEVSMSLCRQPVPLASQRSLCWIVRCLSL